MTLLLAVWLVIGLGILPALADECNSCSPCHGSLENVHGNFNHAAAPGAGPVLIFADTDHDDAGWIGAKPYFDVTADCTICHSTDLPAVHGKDCATCHPTPYDTLGIWGKGCQQGGCHAFYHQDSTIAHLDYENAYDSSNNCNICHDQYWNVTQVACTNCHAKYTTNDTTPPISRSNALAEYVGPALIDFSIQDNGKVGVGRIFYQLDGGTTTAGGKKLFIMAPGQHQLDFWAMDQNGNTESAPNSVFFNIIEDTTAPTTTSNARASYVGWNNIILTASDASTLGVKYTYYQLDGGPIQTGTTVSVPTTSGIISHTLTFWSEDWTGNVETKHSVNFTTTNGAVTLRLVWGDSDLSGSPCTGDPEAEAKWTVTRLGAPGTRPITVATGASGCPNWDGVDDVSVQVGYTYHLSIPWWDSYYGYWDQTDTNVSATTPGQVIRVSY